jgi:ribose/xylose/arabinose/galactoside ABC-type transport system permease subunit
MIMSETTTTTNKISRSFSRAANSRLLSEGSLILILVALFVFLSFASPTFLTWRNLTNLGRQTSINGIVALGMTFVIISGGIDLSVGAVVGLSGMIAALLMRGGMNPAIAISIALVVGALVGALNGVVIFKGKVPPFIATLGTMTIVRGLIMLISGAAMVAGLPKAFTEFSQAVYFGIPSMIWIWLLIAVIAFIITKWLVFGRNVYTIGSNKEAARLSGISVGRVTIGVYALCSLFAAIAGILFISRIANGVPTAGQGYELEAIAAAVIGGASLSGAEGSVFGTVLGAIIMQLLRNGGNLLGVNPFILEIVIGALIIGVVFLDQRNKSQKV